MNQIPTAEEMVSKIRPAEIGEFKLYHKDVVLDLMKLYAQIHVVAALQAASENATTQWHGDFIEIPVDTVTIDKESILKAYDLNQIK